MKKLLSLVAFMACTLTATAGGLLTNTNQNAHFLRQMSQEAIIDINGLYANPAGTAFLNDGFHLNLNYVITQQSRDTRATFAPLQVRCHERMPDHKGVPRPRHRSRSAVLYALL